MTLQIEAAVREPPYIWKVGHSPKCNSDSTQRTRGDDFVLAVSENQVSPCG